MVEHKKIVIGFLKKNVCSGTAWTLLSSMQVVPFSFRSISLEQVFAPLLI